jgi:hypothetical protein
MRATRRTWRPSSFARALAAAVACSTAAHAEQEPIDLTYRAYEGCPSERQFVAMVVGRASKELVLSERGRGRKFQVTVTQPQRRETVGRLEIASNGSTASREVTGARCTEVVSALALFTALAIDPSAKTEPNPKPEPPAEPPHAEEPPAPAAPPEPKPEPKPAPPPVEAPPAHVEPDVPAPRATRPGRPQVLIGARALGSGSFSGGSVTPDVARGVGLFAQWTTPRFGAYRVGGTYFAGAENDRVTFKFVAGRLDGCPTEVRLARSISFEPCLALELGRVTATSRPAIDLAPTTERRWWVAGDLLARLRFAPIPWLFAEVEGGPTLPFTRYVFLLGNEGDIRGEVHRVPAVGWVLGFGLGARIL